MTCWISSDSAIICGFESFKYFRGGRVLLEDSEQTKEQVCSQLTIKRTTENLN